MTKKYTEYAHFYSIQFTDNKLGESSRLQRIKQLWHTAPKFYTKIEKVLSSEKNFRQRL